MDLVPPPLSLHCAPQRFSASKGEQYSNYTHDVDWFTDTNRSSWAASQRDWLSLSGKFKSSYLIHLLPESSVSLREVCFSASVSLFVVVVTNVAYLNCRAVAGSGTKHSRLPLIPGRVRVSLPSGSTSLTYLNLCCVFCI